MILIYSEKNSPRLEYICKQLFCTMLGYDYRLTTNWADISTHKGASICYTTHYKGIGLHIAPCSLLFETAIQPQHPTITEWKGLPALFPTNGLDIPFDIFAASFFLISRYEEYLDNDPDKHGRFKAENSIAYKNGFIERPLADEWAIALKSTLIERFGTEPQHAPSFKFIPTIDVDHAYAIRHKGLIVNGFKIFKALKKQNFKLAKYILSVVLRQESDPFFNFNELNEIHAPLKKQAAIFFHCGGRGKFDKRTFCPSLRYFRIKHQSAENMIVGLHPSYKAANKQWLFQLERWVLRHAMQHPITHNRYHYLKFTIPNSYKYLAEAGFTDDWSMIYSNDPGFRASTSFPFPFYNVQEDRVYNLRIHPTAVMDKTLQSNKKMLPDEALRFIYHLSEKVRSVNGEFVTLFHNDHLTDAFDEWKGWKGIYLKMVQHFTEQ